MWPLIVLVLHLTSTANSQTVDFFLQTRELNQPIQLHSPISVGTTSKVIFLIHGWSENRTTEWYPALTKALLNRDNVQVIQVEYIQVASLLYPLAAISAIQVGERIGDFILNLTARMELDKIEIIGHSLGGQVAGYTGNYIFRKIDRKVPLITALDPAGVFYQGLFNINGKALDASDAHIVYVLHTDRNLFGINKSIGTIDVFPNGGSGTQPGCPEPGDNLFCSHHRSYWYYIAAIENPNSLVAFKCESYRSFLLGNCNNRESFDIGGYGIKGHHGSYFLQTAAKKPYVIV